MKEFFANHILLACWAIFVVLMYVIAYADYVWYRDNISAKMKKAYEALTEEE